MAVIFRNAYKNYGDSSVLKGVNLTIRQGSIYGLLGASGCGKTTLLSCIVGLKSLDEGTIRVLGHQPGEKGSGIPGSKVGFMPQDSAMYPIFTIREIFEYYGKIYGMSPKNILERGEFLNTFLQLPNLTATIGSLSGGQLRRVSLAVAMIHQPPLLVLDEPTVGIDPVLRQTIWEHMMDLVADGKTSLILSTHYIDESRFCDCVGVMRKGRILDEQAPEVLLTQFSTSSLEEAVLRLCHMDEDLLGITANNEKNKAIENELWNNHNQMPDPGDQQLDHVQLRKIRRLSLNSKTYGTWGRQKFPDPGKFSQSHKDIILSIAKKNLLMFIKHPFPLIFFLFMPLVQLILHNVVVGREPFGLNVAYVSKDWNGQNSKDTKNTLVDYCRGKNVSNGCFTNDLFSPCLFLNQFGDKELNFVYQESIEDALSEVQLGRALAYMEIPKNFTSHFRNRLLYRTFSTNDTIQGSSVKLRTDNSETLSASWLSSMVLKKYTSFLKNTLVGCGQDPRIIEIPLKYNAVYGKMDSPYYEFIQPALIITFMLALSGCPCVVWVAEKRMGVADRGTVAGVKFGHVIGASLISDTVVTAGQMALLITPMVIFYGMRVQGSWFLVLALAFLTAVSGLSYGFFLGSVVNTEMEIILLQLLSFSLTLISSGSLWPLETVPIIYRIFCLFLPASLPIMGMRAIVHRGMGLESLTVLQGFAGAFLWTIIPFLLSIYLNKRKR